MAVVNERMTPKPAGGRDDQVRGGSAPRQTSISSLISPNTNTSSNQDEGNGFFSSFFAKKTKKPGVLEPVSFSHIKLFL